MRQFFPLAVLCVLGAWPAQSDTVLVLPFFNLSKSINLNWIGESISETIRESLASEGVITLDRQDRREAYRRLSIRENALLTRAAVLKIGETLDADQVIYGYYDLTSVENSPVKTRGSVRITAHVLDRKGIRQGPEYGEIGALEELAAMETHLAWQTLQFVVPKTAPSEAEFKKQRPPVRVDAIESYIRGLLASKPEQRHKLFTQAARLDSRFSQPCFQLGKLAWQKSDYKTAADWLKRVTPGDVHYREANFLLGLCRFEMGDYVAADRAFQLVAQAVPLNEVFNNLGAAQSRRNLPEAIENFQHAIEGDSSDPVYHFNLGYALWKQNKFSAAADSFRAVLDRDPEDAEARMMLDRCSNQTGPRPSDHRTDRRERLKSTYEESAYWQLRAVLQSEKN